MADHLLTAFPDEYDLDVTRRIQDRFAAQAPLPYMSYFRIGTTDQYVNKLDKYSTFDEMETWADGADVPMDDAVKIEDYSMTMAFYGKGFAVSRKFVEYNRFAQVQQWAASLADSAIATLKSKHAYVLNNAFATVTYGDGKVLCADDHVTSGGASRDNLLASTALSVAGWEAAQVLAYQLVDYRGKPTPIQLDKIIVGPTLLPKAKKIFQSAQEAYTTDNQINPHTGIGIVCEDQLSSTTAWFGLNSMRHGLETLVGKPFTPGSYVKDSNRTLVHFAEMDFVVGVTGWEGIVGTAGA